MITVFDLQGLCEYERVVENDAIALLHPMKVFMLGLKWLIAEIAMMLSRFDFWVHGIPSPDYFGHEYDDYDDTRPSKPKKIHVARGGVLQPPERDQEGDRLRAV
ncbi:uncharacterized protein LOC121601930 [Anopheles merus]|uniref:uncharacterized protein LOC121601930 n=1 Tax=Anopheles merus TaxID=30066 RepID=UPI001BE472BA|nr:uncharacterized protein LOC121601930 [Anopheles merus]